MGKNKRQHRAPGSLLSGLPSSVLCSIVGPPESETSPSASRKRSADPDSQVQSQPPKRQKLQGLLGPEWEVYDATNLVPFYQKPKDVPEMLKKYFYQRERYFSLYNQGCLLDEEGWYSVTPEGIADVIAEKCRCGTVLDAFCGVGGNAIAFARTCERVIAMDTSETRLRLARHNAVIYGVQDRIEFVLGDYISFTKAYLSSSKRFLRGIDVVFLSPPWGGVDYTTSPKKSSIHKADDDGPEELLSYSLERIKPLPGADLFQLTRRITPHVAFYLPKHVDLQEVSELLPRSSKKDDVNSTKAEERIEVQEAWMGNKLKAVTCYFGGLAEGQETMFPW